jgi:hypothetical protein
MGRARRRSQRTRRRNLIRCPYSMRGGEKFVVKSTDARPILSALAVSEGRARPVPSVRAPARLLSKAAGPYRHPLPSPWRCLPAGACAETPSSGAGELRHRMQYSGVTKALIVAMVLIVAAALAAHFLAHLY